MNRRLQRSARQIHGRWAGCAGLAAILSLVIVTGGCASRRPAPLLVEHRAVSPPTSDSETALNLTLVTYNVWGLPSWMTGARTGRYLRIARELERLDPDVILLQEAWTAKARKSAPANGRWSMARAAGQHTFFQQNGLVTLCKYPIIDGQFYPFSRGAFPDRFLNKGVLKVTVRSPDGRVLNVWNAHLQDGGPPEIHRSQVRELASRVQAAEDGQVADLVGGDFNCTPESTCWRELVKALGPSVQQLGGAAPFVTWDGLSAKPGAGQTLDYIFVKARTTLQNLQAVERVAFAAARLDQRLSDHLGIEAVVSLSPAVSLAGAAGPPLEDPPVQSVAADRVVFGGGE